MSRYKFTRVFVNDADRRFFGTREQVEYRDSPDNSVHVVQLGDTLQTLAENYFKGFPQAANLWWIIAEYQPTPIADPTLSLPVGDVIIIPSPTIVADAEGKVRESEVD